MVPLILSVMTLTVIAFSTCQVFSKKREAHHYALLLVLCCFSVLALGPMVFQVIPAFKQLYISFIPTVFFTLLPGLWLYHCGLTSQGNWTWQSNYTKHFWPALIAVSLSGSLLLLPSDEFNKMFFSEDEIESTYILFVALTYFAAILIWCAMSVYYVFKIIKQTLSYRKALNNVFAEQDNKSLSWIEYLAGLIIFIWLYSLLVLLTDNQYSRFMLFEDGVFLLLFLAVWIMAFYGVSQAPGFASVAGEIAQTQKPKYARSALGDEKSTVIAKNLEHAVYQEKLYLDASLTLFKLAKHLGVPSQYLSQTLSQTLQTSFFDYINKARIEAAKPLLLDSSDTVLGIAMAVGFNARSSFYKAFKVYTGSTPSEFKKDAN